MGSWYGTCAISNLAIRLGDPVRLILLEENPYGYKGGMIYPTEAWIPRSLPIRGYYNNYGIINHFKINDLHEIAFEKIKQDWINPCQDDIHITDEMFLDQLTWTGIFESIERGLALVKNNLKTPNLKEVISPLTEEEDNEFSWSDSFLKEDMSDEVRETIKRLCSWNTGLQHKLSDLRRYIKGIRENRKGGQTRLGFILVLEDIFQKIVLEMSSKTIWFNGKSFNDYYTEELQKALSDPQLIWGNPELSSKFLEPHMKIGIRDFLRKKSPQKDRTKLIPEIVDFMCFHSGVAALRKAYFPCSGSGSQEDELDLNENLSQEILRIISNRKTEYENL